MFDGLQIMEDGYSIKERIATDIRTKLHGGFDETRSEYPTATFIATIKFFMRKEDYDKFVKQDYPAYVRNPQWFPLQLISKLTDPNNPLTTHMCHIIPSSVGVSRTALGMFVSLSVECYKV